MDDSDHIQSVLVTNGQEDETSRFVIDSPQPMTGDEDNWSQQVETDETQRTLSIVSASVDPSTVLLDRLEETVPSLAPKREEPTLKEKLVERERQRRVETERARLKRQFALSSSGGGAIDEDSGVQDGSVSRENGSVAGTLGEGSSVGFLDPHDEEGQKLTYPMERFLQEQGTVIEEEPPRDAARENQPQGVLMERFLKEPVVVETSVQDTPIEDRINIDRSVSFDVEGHSAEDPSPLLNESVPESTDQLVINASTDCLASEDVEILPDLDEDLVTGSDMPTESIDVQPLDTPESPEEPRVLRLTLAEIQEMAALDDASRSNAPPSERDDLSEDLVGELISDFGGRALDTGGTLSQGTPTTAMESNSLISGGQSHTDSVIPMSEQEDSHIDAIGTASISSHIVSSAGGSVTANPPSDIGGDEPPLSPIPSMMEDLEVHNDDSREPIQIDTELDDSGPPSELQEPSSAEARRIVNRRIRPGMLNQRPPSSSHRRAASMPEMNFTFDVDDFDYDKDEASPKSGVQDLQASDAWSPGSRLSLSPYNSKQKMVKDHVESLLKQPALDGDPVLPYMPNEILAPQTPNVFYQIKSSGDPYTAVAKAGAQQYSTSSRLKRAFPDRFLVLSITLLIETPILFMISGGSNRICNLLGRSKYQLFLGFLPLCTAISGNIGLQSSSVTRNAVAHGLMTKEKYKVWVTQELGAAFYLGVLLGASVGAAAFFLSQSLYFALTMSLSQFVSILSGSMIGTMAPLLCTSIFKLNAPKWEGPLVTAIQDLIGASVMFLMSYKLLGLLGPFTVDALDSCPAT